MTQAEDLYLIIFLNQKLIFYHTGRINFLIYFSPFSAKDLWSFIKQMFTGFELKMFHLYGRQYQFTFMTRQFFNIRFYMTTSKDNKAQTLWDIYNEEDFIDAKDNQGDWRVGYITAKLQHTKTFKIRFDGWSSKYDQVFKHNTPKLRPFRTFVVGYTGQQQNPAVREDWKFIPSNHVKKVEKFKAFITQHEKYSVHELNQLLRGDNYMYNDFLMTHKFHTEEGIAAAIQYFELNIQFLAQFLKTIDNNFEEYFKVIANGQDLEIWSTRQGFFKSYYEVFDTNYTIWGCYDRLASFFRDNGELIKLHFTQTKKDAKKSLQFHVTKLLNQCKGFQAISSIITKLERSEELIPFLFLHSFTNLLIAIYSVINTVEKEGIIRKMIQIGQNNFAKLKQIDLKELHKHQVSNFLMALVALSYKTQFQEHILGWTTQRELQLSLKLIICPYFQKKLKGIGYLIQICDKNDFILKNGQFKKWAEKVKLYQTLFMNSDNHQFVKKACELVKFLFIKSNLTQKDIDLILQSRFGKHQTVVKQIYSLVAQFALYQNNLQQKLQLFGKVANLPEDQWDQDYIHMIRDLSQNCYGMNLRQKLVQPFGFFMVYQYAVKVESQFSLNELIHILHRIQKSKIYTKFQQDCFINIQNQTKVWIHIKILLIICQNRIDIFDKLSSHLIQILVKCIINHHEDNSGKIIEDALQLLSEVVKNTNKEISVQEIDQIWKLLAKSSHRQIFLKWLFKKKETGRVTLNQCLNQKHRKHLLSILQQNDEHIKQMDQNQAIFFIELFKSVNINQLKMTRYNIIIRPLSFELQGYQKLWKAIKLATNQSVSELFCDLLAQVHTNYQKDLNESIQNLLYNVSNSIKASIEDQNIIFVKRLLSLTQKLILRDEEVFSSGYVPRMSYIRQYVVLNRDTNEQKCIKFNCMNNFYQFKKLISQKFQIPIYKLTVYNSKQEQIKLQSYYKSMNELFIASGNFQISQNVQYESIVKTCLNSNLDLFFQLLDDKRIQKQVWSIVQKLPISDDLKFKLVQTQDILSQINKAGFYKELYQLKVVTELSQQWWLNFITQSNLARLMHNFDKVNFKTHIDLEYIATLTEIIEKMLSINDKENLDIQVPQNLIETVFQILRNLLDSIGKDGIKNSELQVSIIKNLFKILEHLNNKVNYSVCHQLIQYKYCKQLLILGLIRGPSLPLRKTFCQNLKPLIKSVQIEIIESYLDILLGEILSLVVTLQNSKQVKQYFLLTSNFLSQIPSEEIIKYSKKQQRSLSLSIFDLVLKQSPETSTDTPNMLLIGYLSILKFFLKGEEQATLETIADFIIFKCLFADNQSLCKTKQSRRESFCLLRILFFLDQRLFQKGSKYLVQLHKNGQWRTKRLDDWTITLSDKMKSSTGYVGIKNLGCICYMNSLMQQLFMIPKFRYALIGCQDPNFTIELKQENVLYQVQNMFLNLWLSQKKFYNPKEFCHAFKDYQGNPTNVSEQMDIDQFSNILFDRLDNQMKQTNHSTLIKDMFGGFFSNQIVCKGCPHFSETQQHFLSISLTVKSKKNIYQSLDTMIKGDTLDGDNAYFCQRCNKKVSAVKRVSLKKLPDYLIVTLKRFQFDYEKMMKLKVNEYCEFPTNLNLRQYSRQHLRKQERSKKLQEEDDLSNQYYSYILKGVVVHLGYADSGHYYSYIQDRENMKWYQFNDTVVRNFNIEDLAEQTFGGQTSGYEAKQKIKNAYMLIYQRESKFGNERQTLAVKQEILSKSFNQPILNQIINSNKEQKIQSLLFSQQYNAFVNGLMDDFNQFNHPQQKEVLKYAITVYLTITLREKSQGSIFSVLKKINSKLQKNDELKKWVVSLFSQKRIFDQFFRNCIIRQVKKLISYWLVEYYSQCSIQCQQLFCNNIINKLTEDNENCLQYCLIFFEIGKKCPRSLDYLARNGIVGRFIENIIRKEPRVFVQKLQILTQNASQIGNQIIFEKTDNDKRLKLDNQNGYIWALINLIIARAKQLNKPLKQYITPIEQGYLFLPDTKILKILEEIRNKFQLYEFINLMCYLSTNNKQFLVILSKMVLQGLKDFQSKRYRQFFILFQKIIGIQDEFKDLRLQGFRNLQEGLIHNQKYSLDSNIIQQWIIIIINRNQVLRNHIQNEKMLLNFLMKAATKKIPSQEVARKNNAYGDFMINKLHGVKFPRTKKGYNKLSEEMAAFYQQMINNKFQQSHIWPSVQQTQSFDFKVGNVLAYFESKDKIDYQQAHVESIFMSRMQLHLKKNKVVHIWKDEQKLSLDIKFVSNDQENELNSSRTTEMEIEEQYDQIDDS